MIKIFLIYFLISGIFTYWTVTECFTISNEKLNKLSEERRQKIEEARDIIKREFGNFDMLPNFQIISLLFGWILLPLSLFLKEN